MIRLENILSKIIKYGLYAILLTPLAFWPRALFPFLTPKFILFQILIEIVFGAWIILKIIDFRIIDFRNRGIFDFGNRLFLALLLFFAISFISALFGIDFSRSFWGIGPRMTGLFAELHFLAWFLVLVSVSKSGVDFRSPTSRSPDIGLLKPDFDIVKYLNFSFIVAVAVALTSFYQNSAWGLSFGYGIFNNPTFVAPYLIFHFFWGLYKTIFNFQFSIFKLKGWFYGAGAALLLFIILFAQIRGAVLGLLIGIFALGIGLISSNVLSRRFRIFLSILYFLFFIILVGLWQLRDNKYVQDFSPIKRVTGISLSETSVQTRILAWQGTLKGYKGAPWFGVGSENFNYVFNKNYNPKFLKFGGGGFGETWFDKPHNAFLEILTENGIMGSLSYVFIWITVALALFKLFKSDQKILSLTLFSAFIAYFGAIFFSFDSFGSLFGLYLFLAFLTSHNNTNAEENMRMPRIANTIYSRLASFAIIPVLLALLLVNQSIWRANIADANALRTFPKDMKQGIALFKKSLNYFTPYKAEYQLDMLTAIGSAVQTNHPLPNPEETINYVLDEADKMIASHPNDAAYYTSLLKMYNIFGENSRDPGILNMAESYGQKSLELSPNRQETLFYITKTFLLKGDTKSAVIYMLKAVNAEPSIGSSHWYYGLALIADGQKEKGVVEIKKAIEFGFAFQNENEKDFIKNLGL